MSKEQIAFWSVAGLSTRVSNLESKTTMSEENIFLLNQQVAVLTNEITNITEDVSTLTSQYDDLNGQVINLNGQVSTLNNDVSTLSGQISTINNDVSTLNGQVSTLNGQVSTLNGQVSTLDGQVSTINANITNINGDITNLNSIVASLTTDVGNLNLAVFPVVYGSFSSSTTQSIPSDNSGVALTFNTTDTAQNCSLVGDLPTSTITVTYAGVYRILMSIQCSRSQGGNGLLYAFPVIGGNPVPNSTSTLFLTNSGNSVMTVEFILPLTSNETIGVQCYSATAGQEVLAIPSNTNYPATPSIILTLNRVA